ncbi:hypothetical protein HDU96_007008 [Phlyctochytrium bullatum]|nr:hypothetical protein HDU96_007008 [Phlyctochytrium bullatum]
MVVGRTTVLPVVLFLTLVGAAAAQDNRCFYLSSDSVCGPDFGGLPVLRSEDEAFGFRSEGELNKYLRNATNPQTLVPRLQTSGGCNGPRLYSAIDAVRFHLTFQCARMIWDATSAGCTVPSDKPRRGPLMCSTQCRSLYNTMTSLLTSTDSCPITEAITPAQRTYRENLLNAVAGYCNSFADATTALNKGACSAGVPRDVQFCGFRGLSAAQRNCAYLGPLGDACCAAWKPPQEAAPSTSATVKTPEPSPSPRVEAVASPSIADDVQRIGSKVASSKMTAGLKNEEEKPAPASEGSSSGPTFTGVATGAGIVLAVGGLILGSVYVARRRSASPSRRHSLPASSNPKRQSKSHAWYLAGARNANKNRLRNSDTDLLADGGAPDGFRVILPRENPAARKAVHVEHGGLVRQQAVPYPVAAPTVAPMTSQQPPAHQQVEMVAAGGAPVRPQRVPQPTDLVFVSVVRPHRPRTEDELELAPGQVVVVLRCFDDGWALGILKNTGTQGVFPLACVTALIKRGGVDALKELMVKCGVPLENAAESTGTTMKSEVIDALWEYSDPKASEIKFADALASLESSPAHAEVLTQLARSLGLQGRFDEARAKLDEAKQEILKLEDQLHESGADYDSDLVLIELRVARARHLLEVGRVANSSGDAPGSVRPFRMAVQTARLGPEDRLQYYELDAIHMLAIVEAETDERIRRANEGLELLEKTSVERSKHWTVPFLNNLGWELHGSGRFEEALEVFKKAEKEALLKKPSSAPEKTPKITPQLHRAKWAVARILRSLKKYEEALEIQQDLVLNDPEDVYVHEELAEIHAGLVDAAKASEFARTALASKNVDQLDAGRKTRLEALASGDISTLEANVESKAEGASGVDR